jgi:hypothetical protein
MGVAEEWADRLGIPLREEEEYIQLQERRGYMMDTGIFLDQMDPAEVYAWIEWQKRLRRELWGVLPAYTGSDDFAGRTFDLNPEQQRQFRQKPRLIVTLPWNAPEPETGTPAITPHLHLEGGDEDLPT